MLKNTIRLGAAASCAYAAYLFVNAGLHWHASFLVPAAGLTAGAVMLGRDGAQGLLASAGSTETM